MLGHFTLVVRSVGSNYYVMSSKFYFWRPYILGFHMLKDSPRFILLGSVFGIISCAHQNNHARLYCTKLIADQVDFC